MRDQKLVYVLGVRGKAQPAVPKGTRFPYFMGVELELENVEGDLVGITPRGWTVHIDESLRNGTEYVFQNPYYGDEAIAAVDNFYAVDAKYTGGARTSTHIHVNADPLTVGALRAIIGLSYIFEDSLFAALKEFRRWCGYCMPLTEMSTSRLRNLLLTDNVQKFHSSGVKAAQNADKYYGLNVSSLRKHGTLEYRYFPGAPTKDELLTWMDYCTEITTAGILLTGIEPLTQLETPEQLEAFIMDIMPSWGRRLVEAKGIMHIYEKLHDLQCLLEREVDRGVARRNDPLVFVSPQLIGLACRMLGHNRAQRDAISKTLKQLKVMSRQEWDTTIVGGGYLRANEHNPLHGGWAQLEAGDFAAQVELARPRPFQAFNPR